LTEAPAFPHFVTFYSFKGGVGRTLALANTALLLAKHGRKVLVIDADLEAPGLNHIPPFRQVSPDEAGFLDLLEGFLSKVPTEGDSRWLERGGEDRPVDVRSFVHPVRRPAGTGGEPTGRLAHMPAGSRTHDYAARVEALRIGQLYEQGPGRDLFRGFTSSTGPGSGM